MQSKAELIQKDIVGAKSDQDIETHWEFLGYADRVRSIYISESLMSFVLVL